MGAEEELRLILHSLVINYGASVGTRWLQAERETLEIAIGAGPNSEAATNLREELLTLNIEIVSES